MKPRVIEVREKHIKGGDCFHCPVELALIDALHIKSRDVSVGREIIRIDDRIYNAPDSVFEFVNAYDDREPVEPFSFELEGNFKFVQG